MYILYLNNRISLNDALYTVGKDAVLVKWNRTLRSIVE